LGPLQGFALQELDQVEAKPVRITDGTAVPYRTYADFSHHSGFNCFGGAFSAEFPIEQ
jgi:hypothetical protein